MKAIRFLAGLVLGVFWLRIPTAQAVPENPPGQKACGKLFQEVRHNARVHFQQQRRENQEFRQKIKRLTPAEALDAIRTHREQQYNENRAFLEAEYLQLVEAIKNRFAEKGGQDEARLQEILQRLAERYDKRRKKLDTLHTEWIALLDRLAQKPDLTWEQLRHALHAFRTTHRPDRKKDGPRRRPENRHGARPIPRQDPQGTV